MGRIAGGFTVAVPAHGTARVKVGQAPKDQFAGNLLFPIKVVKRMENKRKTP